MNEGVEIIKGMFREIIPDIFYYLLFGPSAFFTLNYINDYYESSINVPSSKNTYYPPTLFRIRILIEELLTKDYDLNEFRKKQTQASNIYNDKLSVIEKKLDDKKDLNLLNLKCPKEIEIFKTYIPDILSFLKSKINEKFFSLVNVNEMLEKLSTDVTINEIDNNPQNIVNIIFTGWLYYFHLESEFDYTEFHAKVKSLNKLLLKSVHSSYIHALYKKA